MASSLNTERVSRYMEVPLQQWWLPSCLRLSNANRWWGLEWQWGEKLTYLHCISLHYRPKLTLTCVQYLFTGMDGCFNDDG